MKKVVLASLLATAIGISPVWVADSATAVPTAVATAQVQKEAADVLQVAVRDANAVHDVQFARLTLLYDQPESAKKLTDDAAALLAADDASWAKFVKTGTTARIIVDHCVAINTIVALSEGHVATSEKESTIKSANEKLAKGDQKGVIDTLRLAGISVIENQYLIPLSQTREAVAQA